MTQNMTWHAMPWHREVRYFQYKHLPDEAHEDAADLPPAAGAIRNESLALGQAEMTSELQRELVLLVQTEEGRQVQLS